MRVAKGWLLAISLAACGSSAERGSGSAIDSAAIETASLPDVDSAAPATDSAAPATDSEASRPDAVADARAPDSACHWECGEIGATQCDGPSAYGICGEYDGDACFELGALTPCGPDTVCWDYLSNVTSGATTAYCQTACASAADCAD